MRLTLRNLLAYIDGLLDPESAKDLGTKIDKSKDVSELVHRIKDSTRRMRLGAPKIQGKSSGLDPNSVAEYLDNTLPDEKVTDVEKVCIESDIHLAEVASCHHILTMVLGEPAKIEIASRRRMYAIPQQIEELQNRKQRPSLPTASTTTLVTAVATTDSVNDKTTSGIPDYLREGRKSNFLPWLVTALIAASITLGVLFLPDLLKKEDAVATNDNKNKQSNTDKEKNSSIKSQQPIDTNDKKNNTPIPFEQSENNTSKTPQDKLNLTVTTKDPMNKSSVDKPGDIKTDSNANLKPNPTPPENKSAPEQTVPKNTPNNQPKKIIKPKADKSQKSRMLGRYLSDKQQVLLAYEKNIEQWNRLAPGSNLVTGTRLVSFPGFRPKMVVSGVSLQTADETILELHNYNEKLPSIHLVTGHIVEMLGVVQANAKIHLNLGKAKGFLTLVDADTRVAIEVRRFHAFGSHPETAPGPILASIYVLGGSVIWEDPQDKDSAVKIKAGQVLKFIGKNPGTIAAAKPRPKWVASESKTSSPIRLAASSMAKSIDPARPASLVLEEFVSHRRVENQYLASVAQGLIGNYSGLVRSLNDSVIRWQWRERYIASLIDGMLRGPEDAKLVYLALENAYGKKHAESLYRMLWGFNANQLKHGIADELVKQYLMHPELQFRALSIYNLSMITGTTFGFVPNATDKKRATVYKRWERELKAGKIVHKIPPPELSKPAGKIK